jgi:hypothetical protein
MAFHALQRAGVADTPILDDEPFAPDRHFKERQWQQPLHRRDVGTHLHPGFPYRDVPQV